MTKVDEVEVMTGNTDEDYNSVCNTIMAKLKDTIDKRLPFNVQLVIAKSKDSKGNVGNEFVGMQARIHNNPVSVLEAISICAIMQKEANGLAVSIFNNHKEVQ